MNGELLAEITKCFNIIEHRNYQNRLDKNLLALHGAKIKIKSKWNPIDVVTRLTYSTTFSATEIHLAANWLTWPGGSLDRAANLLHESVHQLQCERLGNKKYTIWLKYLTSKDYRTNAEKEAYALQDKYFPEFRRSR